MTAVEWLMQTLEQNNIIDLDLVDSDKYYTILNQAKEMEREQLKNERLDGYVEGINSASTHSPD